MQLNYVKKVLITGSSGYIAHVIARYLAKNGVPVVGIDLHPHQADPITENFVFEECDIRDTEHLAKIIEREQPSHIIHLAYLMDPQRDIQFEYDVDVNGSKNIFNLAKNSSCVKQFILVSSISVYGAHRGNPAKLTEDLPLRPNDFRYAQNKKEVETWYQNNLTRNDMNLVILRFGTVVGPSYYKKGGIVSTFSNAPIGLLIDGIDTPISFIHEKDVEQLIAHVVSDSEISGIYNLCVDTVKISELAKSQHKPLIRIPLWLMKGVCKILWKLRLANITSGMVDLMTFPLVADPSKLHSRYNYKPIFTAKEAFEDAVSRRRANDLL